LLLQNGFNCNNARDVNSAPQTPMLLETGDFTSKTSSLDAYAP